MYMVIIEKNEFNLKKGKYTGRNDAFVEGEGFVEYIYLK